MSLRSPIVLALSALVALSSFDLPARGAVVDPGPSLPTPALIERAVAEGALDRAIADRYLALAVSAPDMVPAAFRSDVPWEATVPLLEVRRRLRGMDPGPDRRAIRAALAPRAALHPSVLGVGPDTCDVSMRTMPNTRSSKHFYIEYDATGLALSLDGLSIDDYVAALEASWRKEVGRFGWARPPAYGPNPAPGNRYHVRIDALSPAILGLVSDQGTHAGRVGNNPHTKWGDRDADASCMVLNQDYSFVSDPTATMRATAAHEFNHSIQFGYGALSGSNAADAVWVEGGATWMEDEVFDGANDNYVYLWPEFDDDMGDWNDDLFAYPYWITWRGLTERYGRGTRGGAEAVMQRFWVLTSKNKAGNLTAMNRALRAEGTTLPAAYHAYAVAVKFNRSCSGADRYPYCFEEGPAYVDAAGPTRPHGSIDRVGGRDTGSVPDNYALNWVEVPGGSGTYRVRFKNTSTGGRFRVSVACDTGAKVRVKRLAKGLKAGKQGSVLFRSGGCSSAALVITNIAQTAANPSSSASRSYGVSTAR